MKTNNIIDRFREKFIHPDSTGVILSRFDGHDIQDFILAEQKALLDRVEQLSKESVGLLSFNVKLDKLRKEFGAGGK